MDCRKCSMPIGAVSQFSMTCRGGGGGGYTFNLWETPDDKKEEACGHSHGTRLCPAAKFSFQKFPRGQSRQLVCRFSLQGPLSIDPTSAIFPIIRSG